MGIVSTGSITLYDSNEAPHGELTNEVHSVPCGADGSSPDFTGASTTFSVLMGDQNVTNLYSLAVTPSTGITGTLSTYTYTVTGMTVDVGYVDFVATRIAWPTITKRFSIAKQKQGENAIVMTSATTPSGTYVGQLGLWISQFYRWTGTAWELADAVLPTDTPALYYSFDEVPDIPDDPAGVSYRNVPGWTSGIDGWTGNTGSTLSIESGALKVVQSSGSYGASWYRPISTYVGKNAVLKIKSLNKILNVEYRNDPSGGTTSFSSAIKQDDYNWVVYFNNIQTISPYMAFFVNYGSTSETVWVSEIYIGTGAYLTPVIDNSGNGKHGSLSNFPYPVTGVSGKGIKGDVTTGYKLPVNSDFTLAFDWDVSQITADKTAIGGVGLGLKIPFYNTQKALFYFNTSCFRYSNVLTTGVHHFVFRYKYNSTPTNQILDIFIDGINANNTVVLSDPQGTLSNLILYPDKMMDEFIAYTRFLSDSEIRGLYLGKSLPKLYTMADYRADALDDDGKITPSEKISLLSSWKEIYNDINVSTALTTSSPTKDGEYSSIVTNAVSLSVNTDAYILATNNLRDFLWGTSGVLKSMDVPSTVTAGALDNLFSTYRKEYRNLLGTISQQEAVNKAQDAQTAAQSYTDTVKTSLQTQIDRAIVFYTQATDPSVDWTTTALKNEHIGDYWRTYTTALWKNWSGTAWAEISDPVAQAQATQAASAASTAQTMANTAQTTANNAMTSATTANNLLADIASDSKLTPVEKTSVREEWDIIAAEVSVNDTQATAFGITTEKTTYDNAFQALATYLNAGVAWSSGVPSWISDANLSTTTDIVGSTFRANWKAYYDARTALLNAIAAKAKALADTAQDTADKKITVWADLATAQANAETNDVFLASGLLYRCLSPLAATYDRITPKRWPDGTTLPVAQTHEPLLTGDTFYKTDTLQWYVYTTSWIADGSPQLTTGDIVTYTPKCLGLVAYSSLSTITCMHPSDLVVAYSATQAERGIYMYSTSWTRLASPSAEQITKCFLYVMDAVRQGYGVSTDYVPESVQFDTIFANFIAAQILYFSKVIYSGAYNQDGNPTSSDPGVHISGITGIFRGKGAQLESATIQSLITYALKTNVKYSGTWVYSGGTWGAESTINAAGSNYSSLVLFSDGRVLCVYQQGVSPYYLKQRIRETNGTWGAESTVNAANTNTPSLVLLPDGRVICVYHQYAYPYHLFQRIRETNGTWGAETTVNAASSIDPSLVLLPDGKVLCVYRQGVSPYYLKQRIRETNGTWGAESTVSDSATGSADPSLILLPDGKVLCVYKQHTSPYYLVQRIRETNGTWGAESTINAASSSSPSLVILLDNRVLCVYRNNSSGYLVQRIRETNGTWGAETTVSDANGVSPSLVLLSGEKVLCVYVNLSSTYLVQRIDNSAYSAIPVGTFQTDVGAGIVEVGQNSSGTWVKFSDGTMMCWFVDSVFRTTSSANAPVCFTNLTYLYPISFVSGSAPVVFVTAKDNVNDLAWPAFATNISNTGCNLHVAGRTATTETKPGYLAIGRYK